MSENIFKTLSPFHVYRTIYDNSKVTILFEDYYNTYDEKDATEHFQDDLLHTIYLSEYFEEERLQRKTLLNSRTRNKDFLLEWAEIHIPKEDFYYDIKNGFYYLKDSNNKIYISRLFS